MKYTESIDYIREQERNYHDEFYKENNLYEQGSWIQKPVPNVMKAFEMLDKNEKLSILDLGSGVGRNSIEIARQCKVGSIIDCVDILPSAINILQNNAKKYDVEQLINGKVEEIENMRFIRKYDFIIAVSVLEHIKSVDLFYRVLKDIRNNLKDNGVACLIINSEIEEIDIATDKFLAPQFEINLKTNELLNVIAEMFGNLKIVKQEIKKQSYQIRRENKKVLLKTNAVTFIIENHVTNNE